MSLGGAWWRGRERVVPFVCKGCGQACMTGARFRGLVLGGGRMGQVRLSGPEVAQRVYGMYGPVSGGQQRTMRLWWPPVPARLVCRRKHFSRQFWPLGP